MIEDEEKHHSSRDVVNALVHRHVEDVQSGARQIVKP